MIVPYLIRVYGSCTKPLTCTFTIAVWNKNNWSFTSDSIEFDELIYPTFRDVSQMHKKANILSQDGAVSIQFHYGSTLHPVKTTDQSKKGNLVIVNDEILHMKWRLAVIEDLNIERDGLTHSTMIVIANDTTGRPFRAYCWTS